MATTKEMREKRMQHIADSRKILERANAEKREMTSEENAQFGTLLDDAEKLKTTIEAEERSAQNAKRLADAEAEVRSSAGRRTEQDAPPKPGDDADAETRAKSPVELEFRGRKYRFAPGTPEHRRAQPEYRAAVNEYMRLGAHERRALQTDLDVQGGYITVHEQMMTDLLKELDDEVFIRKLARKFTTTAQTVGTPTRTSKLSTFAWGGEITPPTPDTALKFGKRALMPHYMSGAIYVSRDLMRSAVMSPEQIVREEMVRDSGELEERAFMTGDGAQKPLGVFTASADGVPTSRDFSAGNATDGPTWDGLQEAKFGLKQRYRAKAQWLFHRDTVKKIAKLREGSGTGQYLWQPSVREGVPDRIAGLPYIESEWVPNTFTTGLYVGMLADWSFYWIVDGMQLELQKLVEVAALTNQDVFLMRRKVDGSPVMAEAFARVKLG